MGIYDREYYRREGPGFLAALTGRGQACKWLIIANVAAFIAQWVAFQWARDGNLWRLSIDGPFTDFFILNPEAVLQGEVWRLFTYSFLHAMRDPFHILFNMLILWWLGSEVEEMYGTREFLTFYLLAALLGGIAFQLAVMLGTIPSNPCLGASGAVTAVMVLYACHFPNRIVLLFFVLPMPIWLLVAVLVAVDALGWLGGATGQRAVVVHLAGAAFGFLYARQRWHLSGWLSGFGSWWSSWRRRRARPRLRVFRDEEPPTDPPVPVGSPVSPDLDEHLEAKLDAVLEKVSRHGKESLTESERNILMRASEVYRRRRT